MQRLIILCFILTFTAVAAPTDDPNHISINCGRAAPSTALNGRRCLRDAASQGSSTTATVKGDLLTAVDPVPYYTARISHSQFSYSFHITPGQKLVRFHFNPVSYHGFQSSSDFFSVEAGPFTLLANISASVTARVLAVDTFIREFCVILEEHRPLHIVFSPETSPHSKYTYAFINGIEIISVSSPSSYCHGGDEKVPVVGKKYAIHVENSTALEMVHRQDIKWGSVSSDDDMDGMFGLCAKKGNKAYNRTWRVSVDVGFRYLVRIHMCELGIIHKDFMLLINNMTVLTSTDIIQQRGNQTIIWYNNYMVIVEGRKREGKRMIYISLHSQHEFLDRHGPFEGFQIFKLSNHDRSLAGHNPLPPGKYSTSHTTQSLLSHLGRKNVIATVVFTVICMLNIIVYLLQQMLGADSIEEENQPSERAKRHCRCFSLAELQSATENFHISYVLGRGGFGKVYKGFIDNRREIVAIKRSKPDSNQGEHQFWTEVETLSELRHANLVSLIGYCKEQREMMLVYEYMPGGTLADHLYKLARKGNGLYPLSWKQRLKICIGAGRALDYLHTGHGIIHRDVKTSNILLDGNFVAKVSDFGLAKTGIGCDSQTQDTTKFKGTVGYIDPDYFKTHKITKKSDTYAFGVVLLEVLCGRPAVEPWNEEEKRSLTMWAKDNICKGQFDHIIAPSLRGEISPDSLKTFVKVAERCLHDEPKKRPAIARVVIKLEFAFQQQELAESLVLNEKASGEDVISCTDKSQENVNLLVPNEDKSVGNDLPGNDRTIVPVNLRPTTSSFNEQTVASLPREHTNSRMINSGRKSMMLRISQKLWPWNAFRKIRKPSNKTDSADILASAPIAHRTSNIASQGSTITYKRATGMILTPTLKIFSFEEVKTATRNFSEETVLGEGSYGKVYKGWIHKESDAETQGGSIVAIKKLNHESMQGFNRWQSEVNFLGRLSHPNLVKLLGYGWDDEELFLVYEYIPCGTLADHLYKLDRKSNDLSPLSWKQRLMICIGVGRALDYLQTGHGIIHHHVNASNILLDGMFRAKLSDFSLAVAGSGSESETQDSINPIGTSGYTGTNYYRTRKLTTKGDTYSFGVLLLEVLCGGPTMDQCNGDDKGSLPMWAINNISKGQVDNIVAPSLRGEISPDSLKTFVKVAERCLHEEPKKRPASAHIIIELELALQQQEKAESLSPKENTSAKNASSSTDTCQKKGGGGDEGGGGSGDGGGAEGSGNKGGGSRDGGGGSGGGGEGGASVGGGSRDGGGGNSGGSEGSNGEGGGGGDGGGGDNGGCKDSSSDGRGGGDDDGGDSEGGDDGGGKGGDNINVMGPNEKINVSNSVSPSVSCQILPHPDLRIFTFSELKAATRNFRSDMILGQGGFGIVYKGWFDGKSGSGTLIAVKRLHPDSWQGITEWQSELNFLGRLSHPNLVKLLGYCWEDKELLLVYEFMAKGSLDNHLFRRGASVQPLPWDIRLKILIGAAHGLAFLHESDKTVIYRDFKASNILLDTSFNAKLSDFGLAKMGPTNSQSHVTTQVMGTFGYAAPEYFTTGHLYVKSDVYGFGVVVVEMLTGLRALDTKHPSGQHCLTD